MRVFILAIISCLALSIYISWFLLPQISTFSRLIMIQLLLLANMLIVGVVSNKNVFIKLFKLFILIVLVVLAIIIASYGFLKYSYMLDINKLASTFSSSLIVLLIPGFTVLLALKIFINFNTNMLEFLILSYFISLFIASLIALTCSPMIFSYFYLLVVIIFFIILTVLVYKDTKLKIMFIKEKLNNLLSSFIINNTELLGIIIVFYSIILKLYPETTFIPYYDITRHYSMALRLISKCYDLRGPYPSYWGHIAIIYSLAGNPLPHILNTVLVFWNILVLLSFYLSISRTYDKKHAVIATYLFLFGGGLSWFFVIEYAQKGMDWTKYLARIDKITNSEIIYGLGPFLWFWYRPFVIGTSLIFMLYYYYINYHVIHYKIDINEKIPLIICSFLAPIIFILYHPSELFLMIIILLSIAIVSKLSFNNILLLVFGAVIGSLIKTYYDITSFKLLVIFSILVVIVYLIHKLICKIKSYIRKKDKALRTLHIGVLYEIFIIALLLSFPIGIYQYLLHPEHYIGPYFSIYRLSTSFYVYLVLLIITGPLALLAMLDTRFRNMESTNIFLTILLLAIVMCKILTYINEHFILYIIDMLGYTYFERRIVSSIIFSISCIFGSHTIIKLLKRLHL